MIPLFMISSCCEAKPFVGFIALLAKESGIHHHTVKW